VRVGAPAESLGAELAATAGEGAFEPSELVEPGAVAPAGRETGPGAHDSPESRGNGQSPAITKSAGKEPG